MSNIKTYRSETLEKNVTIPDSLVDAEYACPQCGERGEDRLEWIDDETVMCAECGAMYSPGEK